MISGSRIELPVAVDRDDDDHEPVLGEMLAVAHDHLRHFLRLGVDEDLPLRHALLEHADVVAVDLRHLPVRDHDAVRHADFLRQPRVMDEMPQRAVHGDEELRPRDVEHQLQLFLAGVAGDVDVRLLVMHDLGAAAIEVVDHVRDRALVAGNRARGDDHDVALLDRDLLVLADGHARERRRRLALRAGGEDDQLARRRGPCALARASRGNLR